MKTTLKREWKKKQQQHCHRRFFFNFFHYISFLKTVSLRLIKRKKTHTHQHNSPWNNECALCRAIERKNKKKTNKQPLKKQAPFIRTFHQTKTNLLPRERPKWREQAPASKRTNERAKQTVIVFFYSVVFSSDSLLFHFHLRAFSLVFNAIFFSPFTSIKSKLCVNANCVCASFFYLAFGLRKIEEKNIAQKWNFQVKYGVCFLFLFNRFAW